MFFRHASDKVIFPLVALAFFVFASYRPRYHLRTDMPPDFFSAEKIALTWQARSEQEIASAYWESAKRNIQWIYPHGYQLPAMPPAEFRVDTAMGTEASDPLMRLLYWHRLQNVWYLPDTWQPKYEWDFSWLSTLTSSGALWIRDHFDRLFIH